MKKFTALLILIFVLTTIANIAVPVNAAFSDTVEFNIDREDERITVSGITSSCRSNVSVSVMLMLPPDDGETSIETSQEERDNAFNARLAKMIENPELMGNVIEYVCEFKTINTKEKNGVISHSFNIGGNGGLYRLIIKTDDGDSYTKDFYFFPKVYYNAIVEKVNKAESPLENDNYSVKHYLENDIKLQDMFYDLYKNYIVDKGISTDRIYNKIYDRKEKNAFKSYNELESFIKRQIASTALFSGNAEVFDEVLSKKEYTDALMLTWNSKNELNALKNFKDETKTDISDKNRIIEYLSHSDGDSDYEFAAAVFMSEYSRLTLWSQVKPLIKNYYDSVLGLDYSRYVALKDTQPVDTALIGKKDIIVYNRFENLKEAFNELVSKDNTGGGKTNSGGGGGGGKGSGTKIGVSTQLKEETLSSSVKFYDIENVQWAQEAIYALAKKGIVSGIGNGCFNPSDYVTREQFITMIVRLYDLKAEANSVDFMDAKSDEWYYPYIATGLQNGIINGIGNGMFGVGSYISRQDMALIANRALKLFSTGSAGNTEKSFADIESVDDYAKEAVMSIAGMGIINGYEDGTFRPHGFSTRAEAAKIIYGLGLIK